MIKQTELKTKAVVIHKSLWKESSLILKLLTQDNGLISVIAQGARKNKSPFFAQFESGQCVNLVLRKSVSAQMYKVIDSNIDVNVVSNLSYSKLLSVQIMLEIFYQLEISSDESRNFYDLLVSFIDYVSKVEYNHILVVWRCMIRLYDMLGFPFELKNCSSCGVKHKSSSVYLLYSEYMLVCDRCIEGLDANTYTRLSESVFYWISQLPETSRHVKSSNVIDGTIIEMNQLLKEFLNFHIHKKFHFKALELYEELFN